MSKTTKFVVLINVIVSILLVIIIGSTLYAWYIRTSHTESVDVSTNGIVLSYEIDDDDETINTSTYSVENISFFDFNNEDEGKYFTVMAKVIKFEITNKSKKKVDITLSFVEPDSYANPFVACVVTDDDELDSTDFAGTYSLTSDTKFLANKKYYTKTNDIYSQAKITVDDDVTANTYYEKSGSVYDYLDDNELADVTFSGSSITKYNSSFTSNEIATNESIVFYVYVYGIQQDDSAPNDLLYTNSSHIKGKTYTFDLQIEAVVSPGQAADITEEGSSSANA